MWRIKITAQMALRAGPCNMALCNKVIQHTGQPMGVSILNGTRWISGLTNMAVNAADCTSLVEATIP